MASLPNTPHNDNQNALNHAFFLPDQIDPGSAHPHFPLYRKHRRSHPAPPHPSTAKAEIASTISLQSSLCLTDYLNKSILFKSSSPSFLSSYYMPSQEYH
jgi:hypothetical protein